ncbi:hypothetical protein DF947_07080 [Pedobacter paludis]|uniref:Uncharacterized protein n=1 Tax=Pedobacter paludis TaxID=2203212 RepID=A0A317F5P5_9SPHI|nr:hypothetical protein DF947_07080 [Pedobacter paludis]
MHTPHACASKGIWWSNTITKEMEEFIIEKIRQIFIVLMICIVMSCKTYDECKIPQKIIFESSKYIVSKYK